MNKKNVRPFGIRDQIGYVFGDMAGSFVNLFVDAYFLFFCTNVLEINPIWMGNLFVVARLWDAINDPIMGSLPDRWRLGKSGDRFKPWIKLFMVPLALSGVLCFWNVPLKGVALHTYVAVAYVMYGMSYTGTSMPFGAMASVVTQDAVERSKLSTARSIGGAVVGIGALSLVPIVCFDKQSQIIPERFTLLATIFGVCSLISYTMLNKLTCERIHYEKPEKEKFNYGAVLRSIAHNRPLIGVMVATLGAMMFATGSGQLRSFIYKDYYANTNMLAIISFATIPILVVCIPTVPKLVAKFGKKATLMFSIVFSTVFSVIPMLIEIKSAAVYTAFVIAVYFGQSVFTMLVWAVVTDCLDYGEWKLKVRSDGSMYSIYTFSRKIGSTIASAVVSYGLAAIGFVSGSSVAQTADAVHGMYYLTNLVPVLTCALELIGIGLIFNLNKKTTEQMYRELREG